jgi:TP901 family phage tail tape measure protein
MALNINLASAIVQLQLDRSQFDPALAQVIARLNSLRGLGAVKLNLDRSQATSSLNLIRQQLDALKKDAEVNLTVSRGGGAGGGRGGFGPGGGALGQGAMGLAQGLGISGFAFSPAMAAGQMLGSGLRDAVGTAMDLEATFVGIQRVSGQSAANVDKFKQTIFEISKSQAGVSVKDLTDIAGAGAKAGITDREGMGGLETFTRGMAKVRNSVSGMGTEQLANDMVRMLTLFSKGTDYVESFGSVLARMDNVSTSSAADILDISKSLSGTFASLNLTIPQVMAFSSVISDVGLTNQQGASSFSQILRMMASDSAKFAEAIGMPVEKFQAAIKQDALGALKLLIDKFKEINEVDPIKAQEWIVGLGFRGVKTAGAFQQLASMIDQVAERTSMAIEEESTLGSLQAANNLNSTTAISNVQLLKNAFTELADAIGSGLVKPLTEAARAALGLVNVANNQGGRAEEAHLKALQATFGGASREDAAQLGAESTTLYQKLFGDDPEVKNRELMKAAAEREKKATPAQVRADQVAAVEADNARRRADVEARRAEAEQRALAEGAARAQADAVERGKVFQRPTAQEMRGEHEEGKNYAERLQDYEEKQAERKRNFSSQHFSGGDDFARSFITDLLSTKDDTPKLTLEEQKQANKFLADISAKIAPHGIAAPNNGPMIFKGRS